jgi:hypothetical protein
MSKYRVVMTRSVTESCVVIVDEGDNKDPEEAAFNACREPGVEWDSEGSIPDDPQVEDMSKVEVDGYGACIYCGMHCCEGQMCDEQQAGGFKHER